MTKHYIYDVDEDTVLEKYLNYNPLIIINLDGGEDLILPLNHYIKILIYSEKFKMVIMIFLIIIGRRNMLKWK